MSFEHRDERLQDLQIGGSGQLVPGGKPGPADGDEPEDGAVAGELDGEELQEELLEDEVEREEVKAEAEATGHGPGPIRRLYRGETSFDFVGRRKWWFLLSAIIIVAGLFSLGFRGLNLGITFKGGTSWTVISTGASQARAVSAVEAPGQNHQTSEALGSGSRQQIEVQADLNSLTPNQRKAEQTKVTETLAKLA